MDTIIGPNWMIDSSKCQGQQSKCRHSKLEGSGKFVAFLKIFCCGGCFFFFRWWGVCFGWFSTKSSRFKLFEVIVYLSYPDLNPTWPSYEILSLLDFAASPCRHHSRPTGSLQCAQLRK